MFKVFEGFKPVSGSLKSVRIYLSEFGKERMMHEDIYGPPKAIFGDDKDERGPLIKASDSKDFDEDKLRKYQIERLRYYYGTSLNLDLFSCFRM